MLMLKASQLQGAQDEAILRAHENAPPPPELDARIAALIEKHRGQDRGLAPAGAEFVELLDNKRRALRRELCEVEARIIEVLDEIDNGPITVTLRRNGSGNP